MTPVSHVAGASFDRSLACCLRRLLRSTLLHSLAQITMALTDGIVIKVRPVHVVARTDGGRRG